MTHFFRQLLHGRPCLPSRYPSSPQHSSDLSAKVGTDSPHSVLTSLHVKHLTLCRNDWLSVFSTLQPYQGQLRILTWVCVPDPILMSAPNWPWEMCSREHWALAGMGRGDAESGARTAPVPPPCPPAAPAGLGPQPGQTGDKPEAGSEGPGSAIPSPSAAE